MTSDFRPGTPRATAAAPAAPPITPQRVQWGSIGFNALRIVAETYPQILQGIRQGPEVSRDALAGLTKIKLEDWSGGLVATGGISSWRRDLNKYYDNPGLQTRIQGCLILPEAQTFQLAISSGADISGFNAANKRVHSSVTSLGDTGVRWLAGVGTKIIGNTSVTNAALVVRETLTDLILCTAEMMWNSTLYWCVSTDGSTDDLKGTTDVSGSAAPSWTNLVAYTAATDEIWAIQWMPPLHVNILNGRYNSLNYLWSVKDTASVPATPQQVVYAQSRTVKNTSATTQNTGATAPGNATNAVGANSAVAFSSVALSIAWANPSNALASDDSRATCTFTSANNTSEYLAVFDFGFNLPSIATPVGYLIEIEKSEAAAADNITDEFVGLFKGIRLGEVTDSSAANEFGDVLTQVGANMADTSTEWSTSDATAQYGGSSNTMGTSLTAADVNASDFGVAIVADSGSATAVARVDAITLTVYYTLPGFPVSVRLGASLVKPSPVTPNRMATLEPDAGDTTGITKARRLIYRDIEYDADGDRFFATEQYPNTSMRNVHHAEPFQGGYLVTGGPTPGPGIFLKHVDSQGQLRDFAFPRYHGGNEVRINNIIALGQYARLEVFTYSTAGAVTDRQWWYYFNGKYYPDSLRQSKAASTNRLASGEAPLYWSTAYIDPQQSQQYCIWPDGTGTSAVREYVPPDPSLDPRLLSTIDNVSLTKTMAFGTTTEDTALALTGLELDMGHEEAEKTLLVVSYHGRRASADAGSYGTVTFNADTGGDLSVASAEVSNTFNAAYSDYNVPSAGVAYTTLISQVALTHAAGSTKTPDGVSIVLTTAQQWPHLRTFDFFVPIMAGDGINNFYRLVDELAEQQVSKNVQTLRYGSLSINAVWETEATQIRAPGIGQTPGATDQIGDGRLRFREVPGG